MLSLLLACNTSDDATQGSVSDAAKVAYAIPPEDVAAPPSDATVTASGLAYKVIRAGTGSVHPKSTARVEVHYTGWTTDGEMFDSSHKRDKTLTFGLNRVIAGWTEGLQLMVEGEKARLWIPEDLAYKGSPGKPAGMLVFDVELVKIVPAGQRSAAQEKKLAALSATYPAPDDVHGPPADARTTASGLSIQTLSAGTGTRNPGPTDEVEVHYTGWQTDGTTFDTSYKRGKPVSFPLNRVIKGWTEGLQLMKEGEKARLWIPANLAYGGRPGRPQGMLVFDVELLTIK